jgi:hypothetical protein
MDGVLSRCLTHSAIDPEVFVQSHSRAPGKQGNSTWPAFSVQAITQQSPSVHHLPDSWLALEYTAMSDMPPLPSKELARGQGLALV